MSTVPDPTFPYSKLELYGAVTALFLTFVLAVVGAVSLVRWLA